MQLLSSEGEEKGEEGTPACRWIEEMPYLKAMSSHWPLMLCCAVLYIVLGSISTELDIV